MKKTTEEKLKLAWVIGCGVMCIISVFSNNILSVLGWIVSILVILKYERDLERAK